MIRALFSRQLRPPGVGKLCEREQAADQAHLGMLGRRVEQAVVIEVEVEDHAVAVDGDRGDVVATVILGEVGPCVPLLVPGVLARATALVAVPVLVHERHQHQRVDAVPFLLGGIRSRLPQGCQLGYRPIPVLAKLGTQP